MYANGCCDDMGQDIDWYRSPSGDKCGHAVVGASSTSLSCGAAGRRPQSTPAVPFTCEPLWPLPEERCSCQLRPGPLFLLASCLYPRCLLACQVLASPTVTSSLLLSPAQPIGAAYSVSDYTIDLRQDMELFAKSLGEQTSALSVRGRRWGTARCRADLEAGPRGSKGMSTAS